MPLRPRPQTWRTLTGFSSCQWWIKEAVYFLISCKTFVVSHRKQRSSCRHCRRHLVLHCGAPLSFFFFFPGLLPVSQGWWQPRLRHTYSYNRVSRAPPGGQAVHLQFCFCFVFYTWVPECIVLQPLRCSLFRLSSIQVHTRIVWDFNSIVNCFEFLEEKKKDC